MSNDPRELTRSASSVTLPISHNPRSAHRAAGMPRVASLPGVLQVPDADRTSRKCPASRSRETFGGAAIEERCGVFRAVCQFRGVLYSLELEKWPPAFRM